MSYLHGYLPDEQERLAEQAKILEPGVFANVDFSAVHHLLEVGCGVGAQTEILLRRFPNLKVTGVDASETQVQKAQSKKLARAKFLVTNAENLPFSDKEFDGAFLC